MRHSSNRSVRSPGTWAASVLLAAAALLGGCATPYVDGNLKDVDRAAIPKPAAPRPVQLLYEFRTKGAGNVAATGHTRPMVAERLAASGLFSTVGEAPTADGALLSIVVDNVPLTDDVFSKGFAAGLTFGLAGTSVTDGYVCTIRYRPASADEPIEKRGRHAIHTSIGTGQPPPGAVKVASLDEAVRVMMRQIVDNVLADIARDPRFR